MNPTLLLVVAVGIGFFSGLRSLTPIALVSWLAIWGWMPVAGAPFWFIGTHPFAVGISILALLELVGDKLPQTPARTHPVPLIARMITGGLSAGAVFFVGGRAWLAGSMLGAFGAAAGTFIGYYIRRGLVRRSGVRDLLVAIVEDFVTIAGTILLVHNLFHTPA